MHFGARRLDTGPVKWEAQVVADRLGVAVRPLVVVHGRGLRRRAVGAAGCGWCRRTGCCGACAAAGPTGGLTRPSVEWLAARGGGASFPRPDEQYLEKGATLRG